MLVDVALVRFCMVRLPGAAPPVQEPAVAEELVRSFTGFLGRLTCAGKGGRHGGGGGGGGGGGVCAARFGRCIYTGEGHTLPYCPANAEVLSRLLPHVARCPLDAFAADGWVIHLLGRGGGRLSANRLATLRLRQATPGDGPTHWAIASVLRALGVELVELSAGLSAARRWGPGGRHHPTGYLAYWLGAAGGPASPPPPPAPWGPVGPCAWPQPPVTLPRLRRVSFLGSVGAADVAALADAAPRLTHLHLMGAVAAGALGALALPALPDLES